jgi:uncharacterized protein YjiS (DUF1127 family)
MNAHVILTPTPRRTSWIDRLLIMFRANRERERAVNELKSLSDERLRDIGFERHDIAQRIDAEMAKINLKRLGRIGLC